MYRSDFQCAVAVFITIAMAAIAAAETPADPISVRSIAEVELRTTEHGREVTKLAPADRLVSGDWVIYTLEVRNTAAAAVRAPAVAYPVPPHLTYVAESAVGPGTDISFSVDGGRSFDVPENLKVSDADGGQRPAGAADYTHIRWQFKNALKGNSVAFVRFRARVK
jgi:uncharacterized repeat protein (TIGR01451 family)